MEHIIIELIVNCEHVYPIYINNQKHANDMAKAIKMYHSSVKGYGENVAYKGVSIGPMIYSPAGMTARW